MEMGLNNMSKKQKEDQIDALYINCDRIDDVIKAIENVHKTYTKPEPECLFIKGEAGVGKSTIREAYAAMYPRVRENGITKVPVLVAVAPMPAAIGTLAQELLAALGDPCPWAGSVGSKTGRLRDLIRDCGVQLIILDEFQHFIEPEGHKLLLNTANWLKNLIQLTNVPVVLIGMPHSECIFYCKDQGQLLRRFKKWREILPFSWKTKELEMEFRTVLNSIDEGLPLPEKSMLAAYVTAFNIMYATDGVIDYVATLIKKAAKLAIEHDMPTITNDLLADAFDEELVNVMAHKKNPFREEVTSLEDINEVTKARLAQIQAESNPKRRGRKKKTQEEQNVS